jgi:hypothetical protein
VKVYSFDFALVLQKFLISFGFNKYVVMDDDAAENETMFTKQFIFLLVFSLVSAAVLAKFSRGLCAYLFTSLAWIFIWKLLIQSWNSEERSAHEVGMLAMAGLIGWAIGTFIIWRKRRGFRQGFFEPSC